MYFTRREHDEEYSYTFSSLKCQVYCSVVVATKTHCRENGFESGDPIVSRFITEYGIVVVVLDFTFVSVWLKGTGESYVL